MRGRIGRRSTGTGGGFLQQHGSSEIKGRIRQNPKQGSCVVQNPDLGDEKTPWENRLVPVYAEFSVLVDLGQLET
jgi:hypothetical protein